MLQAIAVDDEPIALEVINSLAARVNFIQLQGTFTNAFTALEYLQKNSVDVVFLDIKMPDISGMDLVAAMQQKPMIIFTTAYSEHAIKSFELDAVDYLLKPFSLARFTKACSKAHELWLLRNERKHGATSIFLKTGYEQVKVNFEDILFLEASGNYVAFQTNKSKIMARMTFSEARDILPDEFCRIHRSFIVHKSKIEKIERHQVSIGQHKIPVSNSYSDNLSL